MARPKYIGIFDDVNGAIDSRHKCISRTKHYVIDEQGHTVTGHKEFYHVDNPRDYKRHPQLGAEKLSSDAFAQARRLRLHIQQNMPDLFEQWRQAFLNQLAHPDTDSPWEKNNPSRRKSYVKLDNYMETKIRLRGMNIYSVTSTK